MRLKIRWDKKNQNFLELSRVGPITNKQVYGPVCLRNFREIWRNPDKSRGICERKILLWMKREADQARFKSIRIGPKSV